MEHIIELTKIIASSTRIAFLGGAGVSTESGIPDFRSEGGIFSAISRYGQPPEVLLSHSFFRRNTETFYEYYPDEQALQAQIISLFYEEVSLEED